MRCAGRQNWLKDLPFGIDLDSSDLSTGQSNEHIVPRFDVSMKELRTVSSILRGRHGQVQLLAHCLLKEAMVCMNRPYVHQATAGVLALVYFLDSASTPVDMRFQPVAQQTTRQYPSLLVIVSRRRFASHSSARGHIVQTNPSQGNGGPHGEHPEDGVVTDHEWELRAGSLGPYLFFRPINVTA